MPTGLSFCVRRALDKQGGSDRVACMYTNEPPGNDSRDSDAYKSEIMNEIREVFDRNRCSLVEHMLSMMANPIRFHLLCALEKHPFSVSELVELSGSKLSNVSQQLKMMTLAGYVSKERQGKQTIYSLKDERIRKLLSTLEGLFISSEAQ